ncbi:hypothetical protein Y032_0068g254 [Ancylostoma ceylanicum]|uniref:Trafficking protein particle complex subunit 13 n=1 Tax=Ancylostoma ceylanicum TaxID=53326 RepID=A0A016TZM5_9BILA|nr:hypothetical protein Y032_0068g254 [Ancylostoma ceylanicum]
MGESLQSSNQLLSLKVIRLSRPKRSEGSPLQVDPVDPSRFSQLINAALASGEKRYDTPIGEYLIAPLMFENIYLGETFTFYMNVVNESDQKVTDVSVKCELQTNSQRVNLTSSVQDVILEPSQSSGQIITHEVKEIGQHILICSVNYKTSSDEKMYFRKFFKFPVGKPIDVKTKFYNAENSDVYLEAQIENTSATAMVLERVELEPSPNYTVTSIKSCDENELNGMYLKPRDIRQFLFCLSPKDIHNTVYKDMTNIGKLDMSWRTHMGERGRLQTSPLQRIAPAHGDVRLSIENLPATVPVRKPFTVDCRLYNCCERSLDLRLELLNNSQCLFFCSISGIALGQVPPNGNVAFSVEVLPIAIGFQSISGIRIVDSFAKKVYDHDDIAQVFVM